MVDTCCFCLKPLGGVYTYHWGQACHHECVPMDEKDRRLAAKDARIYARDGTPPRREPKKVEGGYLYEWIDADGDHHSFMHTSSTLGGPAAPEGQQPVGWQRYGERTGWTSVDPGYAETLAAAGVPVRPLYTRPSQQAVTEAMVEAAAKALARNDNPKHEKQWWPSYESRARLALKAAMEAGR